MATIVTVVPGGWGHGRAKKYTHYLDGQLWCLKRGEDYTTAAESVRSTLWSAAHRAGVVIKTRIAGNGEAIYVQAFPKAKASPDAEPAP